MLINISNHNFEGEQLDQANRQFGGYKHIDFPLVNPEDSIEEIENIANNTVSSVMDEFEGSIHAVHIMGEMSLTMAIVEEFQQLDVPCVASTTTRRKPGEFTFHQFRPYSTTGSDKLKSTDQKKNAPSTNVSEPYRYELKTKKWLYIIALLLAISLFFAVHYTDESVWYGEYLDPVLTLVTLAIAIGLWLGEVRREWRDQLPSRLSVSYMYEGRLALFCDNVVTTGASDIRQWSLSIGKEINGGKFVNINPFFKIDRENAIKGTNGYFNLFKSTLYLHTLPDHFPDFETQFNEGKYYYFTEDPHQPGKVMGEWRDN